MCIAAAQRQPWAFDDAKQQVLRAHKRTKRAFDQLNAELNKAASVACKGKAAWWEVQPADGDSALWSKNEAV
jgi:hypothetical protein